MKLDTTKVEHYDIMCALRGPDTNSYDPFADNCKDLFTARIRCWVGCNNGGTIRAVATDEIHIQRVLNRLPNKTPPWWCHYRGHVKAALRALLDISKSLRDFSADMDDEIQQLLEALNTVDNGIRKRIREGKLEEEIPF